MPRPMPTRHTNLDRGDLVALSLAVLYGVSLSVLSILRHQSFNTHTFDLGLHHQATWSTLHGRFFQYTLRSTDLYDLPILLGDHVNLILLLAVPFYWLYEGAETLLVLQAVVVGSAAWPLFRVARDVTGGSVAALLLVAVYLLNPALHAANLFDFHAIVPAAAFLVWAFWRARSGGTWSLGLAVGLALLCQENVALAVVGLGASIFFLGRRRAGLAVAAAGVFWFVLCFYVLLPHFNPGIGSNAFSRYREFGDTPAAIVLAVIREPQRLVARIFEPQTLKWLFSLLGPFGFVPLLAPQVLVVGASELFLNLISSFPLQRTIDFQYAAIPVAAAALAAPWGVRAVADRVGPRLRLRPPTAAAAVAGLVLISAMSFQVARYGTLRILADPYRASYRVTDHHRMATRFLGAVPPGATVSAQDAIAPHLNRPVIWCFPQVRNADVVLLDLSGGIFPVHLFPLRDSRPRPATTSTFSASSPMGPTGSRTRPTGGFAFRERAGSLRPTPSGPARTEARLPSFSAQTCGSSTPRLSYRPPRGCRSSSRSETSPRRSSSAVPKRPPDTPRAWRPPGSTRPPAPASTGENASGFRRASNPEDEPPSGAT